MEPGALSLLATVLMVWVLPHGYELIASSIATGGTGHVCLGHRVHFSRLAGGSFLGGDCGSEIAK